MPDFQKYRTPLFLLLMTLIIIAVLLGVGLALSRIGVVSEVRLPILAVTGVICMLAALALVSAAFSMMDLSTKEHALALPEGSIRAVIALSLIVIFAIIAVFLYDSLVSNPGPLKQVPLTAEQRPEFERQASSAASPIEIVAIVREPSGGSGFIAQYKAKRDASADDFAKQLLTLLGTLVTSVCSFYFGSQSATAAAARAADATRGGASSRTGAGLPAETKPQTQEPNPGGNAIPVTT